MTFITRLQCQAQQEATTAPCTVWWNEITVKTSLPVYGFTAWNVHSSPVFLSLLNRIHIRLNFSWYAVYEWNNNGGVCFPLPLSFYKIISINWFGRVPLVVCLTGTNRQGLSQNDVDRYSMLSVLLGDRPKFSHTVCSWVIHQINGAQLSWSKLRKVRSKVYE